MVRFGAIILTCLVVGNGTVSAQVARGTIIGTVTDESRAVLPGVTATISAPSLPGGMSTMATDEQGRYRFSELAPGTYTLKLVLSGFSEYTEALRVTLGTTVERNVSLKVGTLAETVNVSGESPMVDTRNAGVSATETLEVIENLPTIRATTVDYLQALPGAAAAFPGQYNENISILGSPVGENLIVHDGVVVNTPRTGNAWQGGDIDGVEEIQTVAVGPSAEYASASGGVVSVVSKSGTNTFQGDAAAYWKPDSLQSRPIKLDCDCPDGMTGFHVQDMKDMSAHLGGPIIRDRLWFHTGFLYYGFNYSEPGAYPAEAPPSTWHRSNTKLTYQANGSTRFSGLLHFEPWDGYATGPTRQVRVEAVTLYKVAHINSYAGEMNKTFGNSIVLTARLGGWWEPNEEYSALSGNLTNPSHYDNLTGITSQGIPEAVRNVYRRDSLAVKLEKYLGLQQMTHSLRFGVQLERAHSGRATVWPGGVQYYDYGGAPDYALFQAPSILGARWTRRGVWGEDQMTFGGRSTLTLGLRYDRLVGNSPDEKAVDNTLIETGATVKGKGDLFTWDLLSPRVGINVKLTNDGRTVLRGNYSRVYREIFLNEIEPIHPGISSITEAQYDPATRQYSTIISVTNPISNIAVDPNLKAPRTDAFSVGLDHQLMGQLAFHTSYVYKHNRDLIGWRDIGGVYSQGTTVLPDGRTLPVFRLVNSPSARLFQRANPAGWYDDYNGFILSLAKRLSNRWQAEANIALSKSKGIRLTGNGGRDPNDVTNTEGPISATSRPVIFNANALYDIPIIDLRISTQYQDLSNRGFSPVASVALPQGRRNIALAPADAFRSERLRLLYIRLDKFLFQQGRRRLELFANIVNVLQNEAPANTYLTFNFFSPTYGVPAAWVQPRHMYVGARVNF
jgi:hypothetical protein